MDAVSKQKVWKSSSQLKNSQVKKSYEKHDFKRVHQRKHVAFGDTIKHFLSPFKPTRSSDSEILTKPLSETRNNGKNLKQSVFYKQRATPHVRFKNDDGSHSPEIQYKVFKPSVDQEMKNGNNLEGLLQSQSLQKKRFKIPFTSWFMGFSTSLRRVMIFDLSFNHEKKQTKSMASKLVYGVNYWLARYKVLERFNRIVVFSISGLLVSFIVYLCVFDTYFLVKNYTVTFESNSYINSSDMREILVDMRENRFLGIFPNNQFWFLNERSLTASAQSSEPEIENIELVSRNWPNGAEIVITTRPILLTLNINGNEHWRIAQDGRVLSRDDAGLRENLVVVERPVSFNRPNVTLQDYYFGNDCPDIRNHLPSECVQLNRFWYVIWLWDIFEDKNIGIVKTTFPSLFDTDVYIDTDEGTRLMFNSSVMSQSVQYNRISSLLDTQIRNQIQNGEIKYIDFRIPKRIFICRNGEGC